MVFHWSLSDSKYPQVSRTLLRILAVLNNVVVWMVSTRPPTTKSSCPFSNPLVTVPNAPITIGIIFICMFQFFQFPSKVEVLLLLLLLLEFFTSVFADGFSLEFEWQQYCPQQYCRLDSLHPSANFQFARPFNNPLVTVPNAPITIGTIVTFMFHSFFNSLARSRYLSFFSLSFRFIPWSAGTAKWTILQILFLLLIIMRYYYYYY